MTPTARNHRNRAAARHERRTAIASLEDVERAHVRLVLEQTATFEEAAELLGVNLTTLWRMRKRWGLS
jgi:DNA-directed RNA polymerase specialized sigma24 family protein